MSSVSFKGDEKMREFIDFLRNNEINKYICLPEIAVMGDTSSGKSSLLSALAQLQLPSNDKITTRCPLRLRMTKSGLTHAEVGIRWDASSTYKDEAAWPLRRLSSWSEVSSAISAAQNLILERGKVEVALDVVEVNVYGPECTDLTLIDLPGIVRTVAKTETKRLIDDIKLLIGSYLTNKRCVILAVQPANVDFHNSQIMADAREVDPETRRTIPVITKPDMIDRGAEGGVMQLLLGHHVDFNMGFHMVKCRGQKALNDGVSMEEGMRDEMRFFNNNAPWKTLDKDLFGVVQLRTKLSKLQVRMIKESIPDIVTEIRSKHAEVVARLKVHGSLITTDLERRHHFSQMSKTITHEIAETLGGHTTSLRPHDVTTFPSEEQILFKAFREDVLRKRLSNMDELIVDAPVVIVTPEGTEERGVIKLIFENSYDHTSRYVVHPTSAGSKLRGSLTFHMFDFEPAVNAVSNLCSEYVMVLSVTAVKYQFRATGYSVPVLKANEITLDPTWLQERIERSRTNDLPCFLSASVFNNIVSEMVVADWAPLCTELLQNRKAARLQLVESAVEFAAGMGRYPALAATLSFRAQRVVEETFAGCEGEIDLEMERHPYTQNHYLFDNITQMRNARLKNRILKMVAGKTSGVDAIVESAFRNADKMSMEEQIVLSAYGKVAAKRVIDNVPMILQRRSRALLGALERALQVTDEELRGLMEEDETTVRKIKKDTAEMEKLDLAIRKLGELRLL